MLNGLDNQEIQQKYNRRKKIYKINPKQLENGNRNFYINNSFKCNQAKRHRLAEWIKKQDPYMLPTENPLQT